MWPQCAPVLLVWPQIWASVAQHACTAWPCAGVPPRSDSARGLEALFLRLQCVVAWCIVGASVWWGSNSSQACSCQAAGCVACWALWCALRAPVSPGSCVGPTWLSLQQLGCKLMPSHQSLYWRLMVKAYLQHNLHAHTVSIRVCGEEGLEQLSPGGGMPAAEPCAACEAPRRQPAEGCRGLVIESGGVVVVGL